MSHNVFSLEKHLHESTRCIESAHEIDDVETIWLQHVAGLLNTSIKKTYLLKIILSRHTVLS